MIQRTFSYLLITLAFCNMFVNADSRVDHSSVFNTMNVHDFAVDSYHNLYLVGSKQNPRASRRFAVAKFNRSGSKCWGRASELTGAGFSFASNVTLDDTGNVYVGGRVAVRKSLSKGYHYGIAIVKYNLDGKILWDTVHREKVDSIPSLIDLHVLGNSNVCALIDSTTDTTDIPELDSYSYKALVYDTHGQKQNTVVIQDWPSTSATMGNAALCVVEEPLLSDDSDIFECSVVEYGLDGSRSVLKALNDSTELYGTDIMITADIQGAFYVAGSCFPAFEDRGHLVLSKFSHAGCEIWRQHSSQPIDKEHLTGDVTPDALRVDNLGNVFVADWFQVEGPSFSKRPIRPLEAGLGQNMNRLAIMKYNAKGKQQWRYEYATSKQGINLLKPLLLRTQPKGDVSCISLVEGPADQAVFHVVNLDSDGKVTFCDFVSQPSDWAIAFKR